MQMGDGMKNLGVMGVALLGGAAVSVTGYFDQHPGVAVFIATLIVGLTGKAADIVYHEYCRRHPRLKKAKSANAG